MGKKIYTVLKLKDEFTKPLKKATKEEKEFRQAAKLATAEVNRFANKTADAFASVAKKAAKLGLAVSGAGIAAGFAEAMDMEGYRAQLETAVKDTQKAGKIMSDMVKLANKTPFEAGQTVEAAAKFEAMSMDSGKWVTLAGDMAGATSKGLDQAVEALIDAQAGELERLKEFGITKNMIAEHAEAMGKAAINNKGQITDLQAFNDALVDLMQNKFAGGMEKQSKTIKGLWSTVTGVTKNSLAKILGMTDDGTIKAGSALDFVKEKLQTAAGTLTKWQQDGTIDKISEKVSKGFTTAFNAASKSVKFLTDNWNWLKPVMIGVIGTWGTFSVALKTASGISSTVTALKTFGSTVSVIARIFKAGGFLGNVQKGGLLLLDFGKAAAGAGKAMLAAIATPAGAVMLALSALIAIVLIMYQNWDKIRPHLQPVVDIFNRIKSAIQGVISKISELINKIKNSKVGQLVGGVVSAASGAGRNATGTSYWKGGLTRVNEYGGEIMNLPGGTQIIPHDVSMKMAESGAGAVINVNIAGNVIGNETFADYIGNVIAKKIARAEAVM